MGVDVFYNTVILTALFVIIMSCTPVEAYQNPLRLPNDEMGAGIADPGILRWMGKYYLYATKVVEDPGIRCWESSDLVNWTFIGYCTGDDKNFGDRMAWSPSPFYYNGKFYLYVCSSDQKHRVFTAQRPEGPFTCANNNLLDVNTLDAVPFLDDNGQLYLFYAGWAGVGIQYRTCSSPVKADGPNQKLAACQFSAENNDNYWTEGPSVYKKNGMYYLSYCGNDWKRDSYQVRAARAQRISDLKPQKSNPIISETKGAWVATGCNWIISGPDLKSLWNVYHCRQAKGYARRLCLDPLRIDPKSGDLLCDGPTWQPAPNPGQPTWHEDFAHKDIGHSWQPLSGRWSVNNKCLVGEPTGTSAEIACKRPIGKNFTAEFNLRLLKKPSAGGAQARYGILIRCNGGKRLQVTIDVKAKSLDVRRTMNGKDPGSVLASTPLPKDFVLDVWHTILLEKRGAGLKAYFDGMLKAELDADTPGAGLGFIVQGCQAEFGWCGFSNL